MFSGKKEQTNQFAKTRKIPFYQLENKHLYFLHHVLIIEIGCLYKLLVYHNQSILFFKNFGSLRGAKIAFAKLYNERTYEDGITAQWSQLITDGDLADFNPPLPLEKLEKGLI